jgi:hypothetical protein
MTPTEINTAHSIKPRITIPTFLHVYSAMHFARLVPAPIQDASGMMLVAPSGSLKSQLLMHLQRMYPTTCICDSNWHYGKLLKMRAAFYNGTFRSIVVPELASIYAGDPRTGGRMEQALQQLAGEGCVATNEKDSRWERYEMRVSVYGAMTPEFATRKHQFWEEGFHRRFLWAHLAMENEEVLLDYLTAGKQADIDVPIIVEPPEKFIPDVLSYKEKMFVRELLGSQKDFGPNHTRYMFLCRTASVMKWHHQRTGSKLSWMKVLKDFSVCLSSRAALLIVPEEPDAVAYRKVQEKIALKAQIEPIKKEKKPHAIRSKAKVKRLEKVPRTAKKKTRSRKTSRRAPKKRH